MKYRQTVRIYAIEIVSTENLVVALGSLAGRAMITRLCATAMMALLLPRPGRTRPELRRQVGVLGSRCSPGTLTCHATKHGLPLAGCTAQAVAGAFVIPGHRQPNWPTVQPVGNCAMCDLLRLEESILPTRSMPVSCPTEPRLVTAPAVFVRCPPNVPPQYDLVFDQNAIDQVNAGAERRLMRSIFLFQGSLNCGFWHGDV